MRRLLSLSVVCLACLLLVGCETLGRLATDIQEIDATTEVSAITSITGDILDNPWDEIVSVGLGYVLALLRRKYKISKGAK